LEEVEMKPVIVMLAGVCLVLSVVGHAEAGLTGYVSDTIHIYSVDLDSGAANSLGPSGIDRIGALDISPLDGLLYASDDSGNLWTVDRTSGAGTIVGNMGRRVESMSFAPDGTLYVIHRNSKTLRRVDTATAATTTIGGPFPYDLMAFAISSTGRAIGWDWHGLEWRLVELDLATASTTLLGPVSAAFPSLDYGPGDVLYGLLWEGYGLYRVDPDTLNVTFLRYLAAGYADGGWASLAIIPESSVVPVPGAALLGTIGLLYSGWRLRRRTV
jgi:hypothetical protein